MLGIYILAAMIGGGAPLQIRTSTTGGAPNATSHRRLSVDQSGQPPITTRAASPAVTVANQAEMSKVRSLLMGTVDLQKSDRSRAIGIGGRNGFGATVSRTACASDGRNSFAGRRQSVLTQSAYSISAGRACGTRR